MIWVHEMCPSNPERGLYLVYDKNGLSRLRDIDRASLLPVLTYSSATAWFSAASLYMSNRQGVLLKQSMVE